MKFRYDGPFDQVDVPALGTTVKRGHQVQATGEVAKSLEQQAGWTKVADPKTRAKKATAKSRAKAAPAEKTPNQPDAGTGAEQNSEE